MKWGFLALCAICSAAYGGTKQLSCDSDKESLLQDMRRWAAEAQAACHSGDRNGCERVPLLTSNVERCTSSRITYGNRIVFLFEDSALKSLDGGPLEAYTLGCLGGRTGASSRGRLKASPSSITLTYGDTGVSLAMAVDRQTLMGASGSGRPYKCAVEDVDLKNQL